MDLAPTPEMEALREVVSDFATKALPVHRLGATLDEPGDAPADIWRDLVALGWLGLTVPEGLGGAGAGLVEQTVLFEELGASLLPVPVFSTVALCLPLLLAANASAELVPEIVAGRRRFALASAPPGATTLFPDGGSYPDVKVTRQRSGRRLTGVRTWILDGVGADAFLVPADDADGPAVYAVEAADVAVSSVVSLDRSRPAARIELVNAPASRLLEPTAAVEALSVSRRTCALLSCAEAVGIARRVLGMTVEYTAARTQFGRPVGSYQAVSHQLADAYVESELARSLLLWAALQPDATTTAAAASQILPAAVAATERAIQLHGGIGMTWESALHRYYKRALLLRSLNGAPHRHRRRVATSLFDR